MNLWEPKIRSLAQIRGNPADAATGEFAVALGLLNPHEDASAR